MRSVEFGRDNSKHLYQSKSIYINHSLSYTVAQPPHYYPLGRPLESSNLLICFLPTFPYSYNVAKNPLASHASSYTASSWCNGWLGGCSLLGHHSWKSWNRKRACVSITEVLVIASKTLCQFWAKLTWRSSLTLRNVCRKD
jgi:hypothetical protein